MEQTAEERKQAALQMYEGYKKHFPEVPEISPANLHELLEKREAGDAKVVVVDVRGADEQSVSMIPDGTLKQADFEKRKSAYRDHQVVSYCTIGYRSGKYAESLRKEGFDASNLIGSILMWTHAGYPLVSSYDEEKGSAPASDEPSRTPRVHTCGKKWRLAGDGYEMVTPEPQGLLSKVKAAVIERFA
ncbi:hypothetical protein KFL_002770010 [Klebsormidium nitens]|uniref:Rhodanese domain-containing protein n=1 Tax=Klebsormidium nitens TaxID=105231 RepID=A0A1Y1I5J0_KLENI|nr:hypothetical protein KFL_002770010 [Klebsormidium nitens]|eukprot:GAQ86224.1 hypothetical protein KFL_002770010 [Klebsormidium nitens]